MVHNIHSNKPWFDPSKSLKVTQRLLITNFCLRVIRNNVGRRALCIQERLETWQKNWCDGSSKPGSFKLICQSCKTVDEKDNEEAHEGWKCDENIPSNYYIFKYLIIAASGKE